MNGQNIFKQLCKCFILFILLLGISFIIINLKGYNLKDVLFIEGLTIVIGALLSTIDDNSMGFYLRSFEEKMISDLFNINKDNKIRTSISIDSKSLSILIVGLLTLVLSFVI